jgi:hypothetical protein
MVEKQNNEWVRNLSLFMSIRKSGTTCHDFPDIRYQPVFVTGFGIRFFQP